MDETELRLKVETLKWLKKAHDKRSIIRLKDSSKKDFIQNIDAYLSDAKHFMEQDDWIRSFEAVIWSWSWIEIGLREGILNEGKLKNTSI